MKINTKTVLKGLDGKALLDGDKDLLLGNMLGLILTTTKSENPYKSWLLATKMKDKDLDLPIEDIVFIKEVVKSSEFAPLITGQLLDLLEK